jgi:hypothetical protein
VRSSQRPPWTLWPAQLWPADVGANGCAVVGGVAAGRV